MSTFPNEPFSAEDGWDDVDPSNLVAILNDCFGPSGGADLEKNGCFVSESSTGPLNSKAFVTEARRRDEEALAAAFEATFDSVVAPFLAVIRKPEEVLGSCGGDGLNHSSHDIGQPSMTQADNIAALHVGLGDCNDKLTHMEGALHEFHSRILEVCSEIDIIRAEAMGTRSARDGKRTLQRHISALIDLVVIPPDIVHLVLLAPEYQLRPAGAGGGLPSSVHSFAAGGGSFQEELSPQFISAMRRLHGLIRRRVANQEIILRQPPRHRDNQSFPKGSGGEENFESDSDYKSDELVLKLFNCKAFREMVATTEDLLIFVCMRIRAFLEPKISALENPRTNSVASQEHVLRQHRQLVRFLQDAASYLKVTLGLGPPSQNDPTPFGDNSNNNTNNSRSNGGDAHDLSPTFPSSHSTQQDQAALMVQHKPFVPFRVVKALYDDLKMQYLTVLSRVYTARIGRYLTALTEIEVGFGREDPAAAQSVASSVVGGLASFFWGSTPSSPPLPPAGSSTGLAFGGEPSAGDHASARKDITRPPLIGDRCTIGPFVPSASGVGSNAGMSALAASEAARAIMSGRNTEIGEDLRSFSLGARANMFRGDELRGHAVTSPCPSSSPFSPSQLSGLQNNSNNNNISNNTNAISPSGLRAGGSVVEGGETAEHDSTYSTFVNGLSDPHTDTGIFRTPTIPHIARMRKQFHTYEETYRSLNHIISDTVTHEYLFLLDFFGADSWKLCSDIFRKTLQNVIDHVSDKVLLNVPRADLLQQQQQHSTMSSAESAAAMSAALNSAFSPFISGNRDLGGLLILFRMTLIFRVQMVNVRQLHVLEPFHHSLLALLKPSIHAALEAHNRSLRTAASLAADKIAGFSANSVQKASFSSPSHPLRGGHYPNAAHVVVNVVPPPEPSVITAVHCVALRYAELSTLLMQLTDLSFIAHYKHLRRAHTIMRTCTPSFSPSGGFGFAGNVVGSASAFSAGFSPDLASPTPASDSPTIEDTDDDEEAELGSWIAALRGNMSILRIEVCRVLSLHTKLYADTCNTIVRRRLADAQHTASAMGVATGSASGGMGFNALSLPARPSSSSLAAASPSHVVYAVPVPTPDEERMWMGATATTANSLFHIIYTWEQRLLPPSAVSLGIMGSLAAGVPVSTHGAEGRIRYSSPPAARGAMGNSKRSGPLYDLGVSLPTGLRREWEKSQGLKASQSSSLTPSATVTPTTTTSAKNNSGQIEQLRIIDAGVGPRILPTHADQQMSFYLLRCDEYLGIRSLLDEKIGALSKCIVALAFPSLAHLPVLTATFDDDVLADDVLLLTTQFDEDDLHAVISQAATDGREEGPIVPDHFDASGRRLRYDSEARTDYLDDEEEPMEARIARLVKYTTEILTRAAQLASGWQAGVQTFSRLVLTYVLHPQLKKLVYQRSCGLLLEANSILHGQLSSAAQIANNLQERKRRLGEVSFEYVPYSHSSSQSPQERSVRHRCPYPLPPSIPTIKGLVVSNSQLRGALLTALGAVAGGEGMPMPEDSHPDL